ncbi:hypothetical protein AB1046_17215 [Promicromonospora sp. Populi]|uniref:hypothetical protein n=1 Tax=Promicromonospora sp. Populi TaxID=3239420 RepID=UPI0034E2C2CE
MSTTAESSAVGTATSLRNLYFVRFGFAIVWAACMFAVGSSLGPVTIGLLVLYPLFDVAAAIVDFRSSKTARPAVGLYFNMALSLLTAIALGVAVTSGIPAVLRIWGFWAITAGIVQLIVAIRRYKLGGQWAMILSGGISTFAGTSFILMAGGPNAMLTAVAGYAVLGGIFFLVSALRLHRVTRQAS